jgi:hypothetical protein
MKRIAFLFIITGCGFILAQADQTPNPTVSLPAHPPTTGPVASGSMPPAHPNQPGAPYRPTVISPNTITPEEWQELNAARAAAMKANPALMQKAAELSAKMRAFQQKLDVAIVQADPNTAPIIAQIERSMPGPRPPLPPPDQHPGLPPPPTPAH